MGTSQRSYPYGVFFRFRVWVCSTATCTTQGAAGILVVLSIAGGGRKVFILVVVKLLFPVKGWLRRLVRCVKATKAGGKLSFFPTAE